jgi:hypothetical protein
MPLLVDGHRRATLATDRSQQMSKAPGSKSQAQLPEVPSDVPSAESKVQVQFVGIGRQITRALSTEISTGEVGVTPSPYRTHHHADVGGRRCTRRPVLLGVVNHGSTIYYNGILQYKRSRAHPPGMVEPELVRMTMSHGGLYYATA